MKVSYVIFLYEITLFFLHVCDLKYLNWLISRPSVYRSAAIFKRTCPSPMSKSDQQCCRWWNNIHELAGFCLIVLCFLCYVKANEKQNVCVWRQCIKFNVSGTLHPPKARREAQRKRSACQQARNMNLGSRCYKKAAWFRADWSGCASLDCRGRR